MEIQEVIHSCFCKGPPPHTHTPPRGLPCARPWSGDTEMGQIQVLPPDLGEVMAVQAREATGSS